MTKIVLGLALAGALMLGGIAATVHPASASPSGGAYAAGVATVTASSAYDSCVAKYGTTEECEVYK